MKPGAVVTLSIAGSCILGFILLSRKVPAPTTTCRTCKEGGTPVQQVALDGQFPAIPGNTSKVVESFKKVYRAMDAFRKVNGRLPLPFELLDTSKPLVPGFQLNPDDFQNPDVKTVEYANSHPLSMEPHYALAYRHPRPNGLKKPAFPKQGERDVWLVSNHFERLASVNSKSGRQIVYYGFMIALFSDGSVSVVPASKMLATINRRNMVHQEFPGETGLAPSTPTYNALMNNKVFGSKPDKNPKPK